MKNGKFEFYQFEFQDAGDGSSHGLAPGQLESATVNISEAAQRWGILKISTKKKIIRQTFYQ